MNLLERAAHLQEQEIKQTITIGEEVTTDDIERIEFMQDNIKNKFYALKHNRLGELLVNGDKNEVEYIDVTGMGSVGRELLENNFSFFSEYHHNIGCVTVSNIKKITTEELKEGAINGGAKLQSLGNPPEPVVIITGPHFANQLRECLYDHIKIGNVQVFAVLNIHEDKIWLCSTEDKTSRPFVYKKTTPSTIEIIDMKDSFAEAFDSILTKVKDEQCQFSLVQKESFALAYGDPSKIVQVTFVANS